MGSQKPPKFSKSYLVISRVLGVITIWKRDLFFKKQVRFLYAEPGDLTLGYFHSCVAVVSDGILSVVRLHECCVFFIRWVPSVLYFMQSLCVFR